MVNEYDRYCGSKSLATFAENLGPWLTLVSTKEYGDAVHAKFSTTEEKIRIAGDIKRLAGECRILDVSLYPDGRIPGKMWISVRAWKDKDRQKRKIN